MPRRPRKPALALVPAPAVLAFPREMSEPAIRTLCGLEYDFIRADSTLSDLARDLARVASELPSCDRAAQVLRRARQFLRRVLLTLDSDITEAVKAAERLAPPPF